VSKSQDDARVKQMAIRMEEGIYHAARTKQEYLEIMAKKYFEIKEKLSKDDDEMAAPKATPQQYPYPAQQHQKPQIHIQLQQPARPQQYEMQEKPPVYTSQPTKAPVYQSQTQAQPKAQALPQKITSPSTTPTIPPKAQSYAAPSAPYSPSPAFAQNPYSQSPVQNQSYGGYSSYSSKPTPQKVQKDEDSDSDMDIDDEDNNSDPFNDMGGMNRSSDIYCFKCKEEILMRVDYLKDTNGNVFHESCFPYPRCNKCTLPCYKHNSFEALGKWWHDFCFRCANCDDEIEEDEYMVNEGKPYCSSCGPQFGMKIVPVGIGGMFKGLTGGMNCSQCGKDINPAKGLAQLEGKNVHPDCLVCYKCKAKLNPSVIHKTSAGFACAKCAR